MRPITSPSKAKAEAGRPKRLEVPAPASGPLLRGVRKYGKIIRVSLIERMTYRGDFFLSTLLRFLPMVTTILLWEAI